MEEVGEQGEGTPLAGQEEEEETEEEEVEWEARLGALSRSITMAAG